MFVELLRSHSTRIPQTVIHFDQHVNLQTGRPFACFSYLPSLRLCVDHLVNLSVNQSWNALPQVQKRSPSPHQHSC